MSYDDLLYSAQQLSSTDKKQLKELVKAVARGTYQPILLPSTADPVLLNTLNQFAALKKRSKKNFYLKFAFVPAGRQIKVKPFVALTEDSKVQALELSGPLEEIVSRESLPPYSKPKGTLLELNLAYIVASEDVREDLARTLRRIAVKLSGEGTELRRPQEVRLGSAPPRPQPTLVQQPTEQPPVRNAAPSTTALQPQAISLEMKILRPAQEVITVQKTSRRPLESADFAITLASGLLLFFLFHSVVAGLFGAATALSILWIKGRQTVVVSQEQALGRDDVILNSLANYEEELIGIIKQHSPTSEVGWAAAAQLEQVRQAAQELRGQHDLEQARRTVGEIGHYLRQIREKV